MPTNWPQALGRSLKGATVLHSKSKHLTKATVVEIVKRTSLPSRTVSKAPLVVVAARQSLIRGLSCLRPMQIHMDVCLWACVLRGYTGYTFQF